MEWILCFKKLPAEAQQVIVSVRDDRGDSPYCYTCCAWLLGDCWITDNDVLAGEVIAWMPLPKPYEEA